MYTGIPYFMLTGVTRSFDTAHAGGGHGNKVLIALITEIPDRNA